MTPKYRDNTSVAVHDAARPPESCWVSRVGVECQRLLNCQTTDVKLTPKDQRDYWPRCNLNNVNKAIEVYKAAVYTHKLQALKIGCRETRFLEMIILEQYTPPPNGFKTFVALWLSQAVSVFGTSLAFFCITVWLSQVLYPLPEQKAQLGLALSGVSLAWGLPSVFLAPIAGAWADRHDRRNTMLMAGMVSALASLLLAFLLMSGQLTRDILMLMMALLATAGVFHSASLDTSYAMLVPPEMLPRANGMMQTLWSLSSVLSPPTAAAVLALPGLARRGLIGGAAGAALAMLPNGAALAILITSITFFLAATVLVFLNIPSPRRRDLDGKERASLGQDVLLGVRYLWRRRPFIWLLGTFAIVNFVYPVMNVLQPMLLKFRLEPDWSARGFGFETALAVLGTTSSAGGILGGVFISTWGGLKSKRVYGVIVPVALSMLAVCGFGLSRQLYVSAAFLFALASLMPIANAHSQTIWQIQTPREVQGRVFSVRRLVAQCTMPVGTAFGGWAGGMFEPTHVLMVVAVLGGAFVLMQFVNPVLLRVEDREWIESLAMKNG